MPSISLIGRKFGKLTVIAKSNKISKNHQTYWNCSCNCGGTKIIRRDGLLSGATKTCGCSSHKFRKNNTPEYRTWCKLKERCNNPKIKNYADYGGRGIKVCDRWNNSFLAFLDDMGLKPSPEHSIDRIDNDGDYEPSNCKYSTRLEQANNRRNNRAITFNGKTMNLAQWVRETGISRSAIRYRLKAGWPINKILTLPSAK